MTKFGLSFVLGGALAAAMACGGRTGDLFPYGFDGGVGGFAEDGGSPGTGGAGGRFDTGGRPVSGGVAGTGGRGAGGRGAGGRGMGGRGMGGRAGGGGRFTGGRGGTGNVAATAGVAGRGSGGVAGFGGFGASAGFGAFGGYGGTMNCSYPTCACGDCLNTCVCQGYDKNYCYNVCFGTGGAPAAGGAPMVCPAEVCPSSDFFPIAGCCTNSGRCGIDLTSSSATIGVPPGCQQLNQPGNIDYSCPSLGQLIGTGPDFPGCCRPDGTCGVQMSIPELSLGCVQEVYGGVIRSCGAAVDGGVAGAAGASSAIQQCVSQARSDCEKCACGSCYDSLIPCFKDQGGCPQILACANKTGCTGVDCYQPNTCQAIIDKAGGLGSYSLSLALPLFTCVRSSGCACGFGQ